MMLRRLFLHLFILMSLALPAGALAQTAASGERVGGDPNAPVTLPVTIIEYASLTCAHCAQFHLQTFPKVKKIYIDTGKVQWIFRDFPLDRIALRAAHLGRCLPPERAEGFLDALFRYQDNWAGTKEPEEALIRMAKLAGLSQEKIDVCLADKTIEDQVLEQRLEGMQKFGVDSTPTIIVNGKKISGAVSFTELENLIEKAK